MFSLIDFSVMMLLIQTIPVSTNQLMDLQKLFYPIHLVGSVSTTAKINNEKEVMEIRSDPIRITTIASPVEIESIEDQNNLEWNSELKSMAIQSPYTTPTDVNNLTNQQELQRLSVYESSNEQKYEANQESQEELFIPNPTIADSSNNTLLTSVNLDNAFDQEQTKDELHRIVLFDSSNNTEGPETIQDDDGDQPNPIKGFRRISVFDSGATRRQNDRASLKKIEKDQKFTKMEFQRNPYFDTSAQQNNEEYQADLEDRFYSIPVSVNISNKIENRENQLNPKFKYTEKKIGTMIKLNNKHRRYPPFLKSEEKPEPEDYLAHLGDDTSVADALASKVKVLCLVMTHPVAHETRARHVKETWGQRCNKLLFMSTEEDYSLPAVKLPLTKDRPHLWGKTKEAFQYVYEKHRGDADWFLKADDDTYVVVENLRYLLADYDPSEPMYFGSRFKHFTPQGYMSGSAGYVLSRAALKKFVTSALPSPDLCKRDDTGSSEDVEIGKCLYNVGVKAMDSRDEALRGRFFPYMPHEHIISREKEEYWYWNKDGFDCCSKHSISFHYAAPDRMYMFDYFIYHLRPYGISFNAEDLPEILRDQSNEAGLENELLEQYTTHETLLYDVPVGT